MPKHWIEEKVYSLEDFGVKSACPQFNVKLHKNPNIRCLNHIIRISVRKESK